MSVVDQLNELGDAILRAPLPEPSAEYFNELKRDHLERIGSVDEASVELATTRACECLNDRRRMAKEDRALRASCFYDLGRIAAALNEESIDHVKIRAMITELRESF